MHVQSEVIDENFVISIYSFFTLRQEKSFITAQKEKSSIFDLPCEKDSICGYTPLLDSNYSSVRT